MNEGKGRKDLRKEGSEGRKGKDGRRKDGKKDGKGRN